MLIRRNVQLAYSNWTQTSKEIRFSRAIATNCDMIWLETRE